MKFPFYYLIDWTFVTAGVFVLGVTLFGLFIPYPFSLVTATVLSLLFLLLNVKLSLKKSADKRLKKVDEIKKEDMLTYFNFSTDEKNVEFFKRLFLKLSLKSESKKDLIFLQNKPVAVMVKMGFSEVNKADVVRAFNSIRKNDTCYILAPEFSLDVSDFAKRFNGKIVTADKNALYVFLKEHDALPQNTFSFNEKPKKGASLFLNLFKKSKSKNFFWFGLIFLLSSSFVPFKLYYIIFGCAFLIFSIFLRSFGGDDGKK